MLLHQIIHGHWLFDFKIFVNARIDIQPKVYHFNHAGIVMQGLFLHYIPVLVFRK
jgi:hypothetical protein